MKRRAHLILFDLVEGNASLGKTTYVHCKAGRGRSTTIVLCYLVRVAVNPINSLLQDIFFLSLIIYLRNVGATQRHDT